MALMKVILYFKAEDNENNILIYFTGIAIRIYITTMKMYYAFKQIIFMFNSL